MWLRALEAVAFVGSGWLLIWLPDLYGDSCGAIVLSVGVKVQSGMCWFLSLLLGFSHATAKEDEP